jgi:formyltetrahydrofolate deformylase
MNRYILKLTCNDKKGIAAATLQWIFDNDGNTVESSQHTETEGSQFFMRVTFDAASTPSPFDSIAKKFSITWELHNAADKPRTLILVSKQSHCLNTLLHKWSSDVLPINIEAVVSNHTDLEKMTSWHNLPFHHLPITKENKKEQEAQILELVEGLNIDLIILARYMQILSNDLCKKLAGRAINIHHSFLPGFKGAKPYHQAFDRGVKLVGASAHYVTADLDEGPIIEQETTRVSHAHTPEDLVKIGHDVESRTLSRAVLSHVQHRVQINGNKTIVFE